VSTFTLVLASKSPRRREILEQAGIPFVVRTAEVEEVRRPAEPPEAYVLRLAQAKAQAVERLAGERVLGADTVVVVDGEVLEKPSGREDAARMIRLLSGRTHTVITGVWIEAETGGRGFAERTHVRFQDLSEGQIKTYTLSQEPYDKAGGYAIQGLASKFIDRVEGCYFNVVGLPVARVYAALTSEGPDGGH